MPSKVLIKLLRNTVVEDADTFFANNEEFFKSIAFDPMQIIEATSNIHYLVSEIQQYASPPEPDG